MTDKLGTSKTQTVTVVVKDENDEPQVIFQDTSNKSPSPSAQEFLFFVSLVIKVYLLVLNNFFIYVFSYKSPSLSAYESFFCVCY